jgi:hypothetical protein
LLQGLQPDLTVIEAPMADADGNIFFLGAVGHDDLLSRAGRQVLVIADSLVSGDLCRKFPNLVAVPSIGVDAVVPWKMAAWPTGVPGHYDPDISHFKMFNEMARAGKFEEYLERYVYSYEDEDGYLRMLGSSVNKLSKTRSASLLEPFRKYLLTEREVEVLN